MHSIVDKVIADRNLPQLPILVDATAMKLRFAESLHQQAIEVLKCEIEKCYYRRFRHCGILYRLTCKLANGMKEDRWYYGQGFEKARAHKMYHKACEKVEGRTNALRLSLRDGITFWESLGLVLWRFPVDPKLDTLPSVADVSFISTMMAKNHQLLRGGPTGSTDVTKSPVSICQTKYMPGKRCVLRVQGETEEPKGHKHRVSFFSKTYNDRMSRSHFQNLCAAYARSKTEGAVVIPRPILHLDGFKTFWQEDWESHALLDELECSNWDEVFPAIATTLAAFHTGNGEGFRPGPDAEDVLRVAHEDGGQFVFLFPEWAGTIRSVLTALDDSLAQFQKHPSPRVPIHGAFRLEQIIARGQQIALTDFDALACGDPMFDVAEFVVSLQFLALTRGIPLRKLTDAARLFCKIYSDLVAWPLQTKVLRWYILAFLISKVFLTVKGLDFVAMQRLHTDGAALIQFWLEAQF